MLIPLRPRHNLDDMAIAAIRASRCYSDSVGDDSSPTPIGELDIMVTRFIQSLQPGKREVEELYQRFLHAAQEAASQIQRNEERRRSLGQGESNVNV
jgi:hypothetical protein